MITVGGAHYRSKEAVKDVCREIVARYRAGNDVTAEADDQFLRDLLALHPEYETKRGSGVAHFRIISGPWGAKSAGLAVVRITGEVVDFSWNACLTPPSHRAQVLGALRLLVANQMIDARNELLVSGEPLVCAVTAVDIPSVAELHMDHADPTFLVLAEQFVNQEGGYAAIGIQPDPGTGISYTELADKALAEKWRAHHKAHAVLRPVLRRVNLSDLRRTS